MQTVGEKPGYLINNGYCSDLDCFGNASISSYGGAGSPPPGSSFFAAYSPPSTFSSASWRYAHFQHKVIVFESDNDDCSGTITVTLDSVDDTSGSGTIHCESEEDPAYSCDTTFEDFVNLCASISTGCSFLDQPCELVQTITLSDEYLNSELETATLSASSAAAFTGSFTSITNGTTIAYAIVSYHDKDLAVGKARYKFIIDSAPPAGNSYQVDWDIITTLTTHAGDTVTTVHHSEIWTTGPLVLGPYDEVAPALTLPDVPSDTEALFDRTSIVTLDNVIFACIPP